MQAHVHHLDAELARLGVGRGGDDLHDLGAIRGHDALDRTLVDLVAQTAVGQLLQPLARTRLAAADREKIFERVLDAPLHVRIHQHVFLFLGQERLRVGVHGQDARIEVTQRVEERHLEVHTGHVVVAQHFTEAHNDDALALIHGVHRGGNGQHDDENNAQQGDELGLVHGVLVRLR